MTEIKQFKPSTKEKPRPEEPFIFPDTESEQLMETISHMIQRLFEESRDKRKVVEKLRNLADNLEQKLQK